MLLVGYTYEHASAKFCFANVFLLEKSHCHIATFHICTLSNCHIVKLSNCPIATFSRKASPTDKSQLIGTYYPQWPFRLTLNDQQFQLWHSHSPHTTQSAVRSSQSETHDSRLTSSFRSHTRFTSHYSQLTIHNSLLLIHNSQSQLIPQHSKKNDGIFASLTTTHHYALCPMLYGC